MEDPENPLSNVGPCRACLLKAERSDSGRTKTSDNDNVDNLDDNDCSTHNHDDDSSDDHHNSSSHYNYVEGIYVSGCIRLE